MEEYRIDLKVRNNIILKKIETAGFKTVGEFCRLNGLIGYVGRIGNLIAMKISPLNSRGNFHNFILKMADLLNCLPEDFFTESQFHAILKTNKKSIEINEAEAKFMISQQENMPKLLEDFILKEQANSTIKDVLNTLSPRIKKVIEMRFGLGDYSTPHTLEEVAKEFNITKERIRQLEQKGVYQLRHPERSERLRDFIEE